MINSYFLNMLPLISMGIFFIASITLFIANIKYRFSFKLNYQITFAIFSSIFILTLAGFIYIFINEQALTVKNESITNPNSLDISKYNLFFQFFTSLIMMIVMLFSLDRLHQKTIFFNKLFFIRLLAIALGSTLLIYNNNLIGLYIGCELITASSLGFFSIKPIEINLFNKKQNALFMIASFFILVGVTLIYAITGSVNYQLINFDILTTTENLTLNASITAILIGFAYKIYYIFGPLWFKKTIYPIKHLYLFLVSATVQISLIIALSHFMVMIPFVDAKGINFGITAICFLMIIGGYIAALKQGLTLKAFCYTNITNAGYILLILHSLKEQELAQKTLAIFLVCSFLAQLTFWGSIKLVLAPLLVKKQNDYLQGIAKLHPYITPLIGLSFAAMIGIPFTLGIFNKLSLIMLTVSLESYPLLFAVATSYLLGLYFYMRWLVIFYNKSAINHDNSNKVANEITLFIVIASAFLIILFGVCPAMLYSMVSFSTF